MLNLQRKKLVTARPFKNLTGADPKGGGMPDGRKMAGRKPLARRRDTSVRAGGAAEGGNLLVEKGQMTMVCGR